MPTNSLGQNEGIRVPMGALVSQWGYWCPNGGTDVPMVRPSDLHAALPRFDPPVRQNIFSVRDLDPRNLLTHFISHLGIKKKNSPAGLECKETDLHG